MPSPTPAWVEPEHLVGRRHRRLWPRRAGAVQRHRPAVPDRARAHAADAAGRRVHALFPVGSRPEGRPRHALDRGLPGRRRQGHHDPHRAARCAAHGRRRAAVRANSTRASAPPARKPAPPNTSPPSRPNATYATAAMATARSWSSRTSRKAAAGCATCRRCTGSPATSSTPRPWANSPMSAAS